VLSALRCFIPGAQSCIVTVLTVLRACPYEAVMVLDRTLRRVELLKGAIAVQLNRLKRDAGAPPPHAAQPGASPHPTAGGAGSAQPGPPALTHVGSAHYQPHHLPGSPLRSPAPLLHAPPARAGSVVPGGVMAPAPSLAAGELLPAGGEGAPRSGSVSNLPLGARSGGGGAGRAGSFALPGPSPLGRSASASTARGGAATPADAANGGTGGGEAEAPGGDGPAGPSGSGADASPPPARRASYDGAPPSMSAASVSAWAEAALREPAPPPPTSLSDAASLASPAGDAAAAATGPAPPSQASSATATGSPSKPPPGAAHGGAATAAAPPFRPFPLLPPSTPSTPYTPAPPSLASDAAPRPAVQAAVLTAQADVRAASLRLLELFALEGAGAPGSGGGAAAAGGGGSVAVTEGGGASAELPTPPRHGRAPMAASVASALLHGRRGVGPPGSARGAAPGGPRAGPHATLLQCLLAELLRRCARAAA
jgi:hypothetical protein